MLAAEMSVLPVGEARKSPRRIVNVAAALREEGATTSSATVLDISMGGCRLKTEGAVEAGSEIWLKLPGLETRRSQIVWTEGPLAGCEFEMPLQAGELEMLLPNKPSKKASQVFRRF